MHCHFLSRLRKFIGRALYSTTLFMCGCRDSPLGLMCGWWFMAGLQSRTLWLGNSWGGIWRGTVVVAGKEKAGDRTWRGVDSFIFPGWNCTSHQSVTTLADILPPTYINWLWLISPLPSGCGGGKSAAESLKEHGIRIIHKNRRGWLRESGKCRRHGPYQRM